MAPIHLVGGIKKEQGIAIVTILQQAAPSQLESHQANLRVSRWSR
jgi:hypothetical protein